MVCSEFLGLLYFLSAGWGDWDYFFLFPFFLLFVRFLAFVFLGLLRFFFFGIDLYYLDCFFFFLFICLLVLASGLYFFFFCIVVALARRIPFKFGMPSRGPCGDPPRLFVLGVCFLCLFLDAGACSQFFKCLVCWFIVVF